MTIENQPRATTSIGMVANDEAQNRNCWRQNAINTTTKKLKLSGKPPLLKSFNDASRSVRFAKAIRDFQLTDKFRQSYANQLTQMPQKLFINQYDDDR